MVGGNLYNIRSGTCTHGNSEGVQWWEVTNTIFAVARALTVTVRGAVVGGN